MSAATDLERFRRDAERRADELLGALQGHPLDVRDSGDIVIVIEGYASPWVIGVDRVPFVLTLLGIRTAEARRELLGAEPPETHVHAVVCVGDFRIPRWIRLRRMVAGGST